MAQNFVLLYQNYADTAVLSGGSWQLPLSNLRSDDIGRLARSTNSLNASTIVHADLGAARAVGGVAIGPTNISPGGSYRIRAYSDAAHTLLMYDGDVTAVAGSLIDWSDTANWLAWENPGFWYGIQDLFSKDDTPIFLINILADDVLARYWTIDIFDAGNADGYLEAGRLLISRAFRPSANYEPGSNSFSVQKLADKVTSLGGRSTYWNRGKQRLLRVSFPFLSEDEGFGDVFRINMLDEGSQVFVVPDPEDATHFQTRSFLATVKAPPPIVQLGIGAASTALDLEEVL
jgi:hypothetical protein